MPSPQQFRNWVNHNAHVFGNAPDMVTPAAMSRAIRFRWFNAVLLGGQLYNLGANIHPEGNGALGGMWISGNGAQGIALHPHAQPTIPQQPIILGHLRTHLNNYFAVGNHRYDYENEIHVLDLMNIGDVFG